MCIYRKSHDHDHHYMLLFTGPVGRDPADSFDPPDHDLGVGGSNLSAGKVPTGRAESSDFLCEGSRREDSHWDLLRQGRSY